MDSDKGGRMRFITIRVNDEDTKHPYKVGYLVAEDVPDAYEQLGSSPKEDPDMFVVRAERANQLIIDLNKVVRKL